ncbi:hypothetical protein LU604_14785 [Erwinia tracheiphila]|uniref:hypothetical protein n=1 Tax=Erwinia tracheiphila TaxID=65700 RepID=UPI001F34D070|nr:hypothetical protein [Erwinia tracheiphila]UIA81932.1 hypothetical protein LU604_14785 [Erwinia tracheiphila]UIA90528.1 hypothetical protein LU632_14360 [Erwinia tracheiphila]
MLETGKVTELQELFTRAAPLAVPDVLSEKFIDWVCLTCVDVRNASGDLEAQDSINDIRQALEEKAEVLRINSRSKSDDE